jgi:biopolymer transport protein ExbB/TolQ
VGDTSNWEFAAVVAAVSIGLMGLLVFTMTSIVGNWRLSDRAARAAREASEASVRVQDLARELSAREAATLTAAGLTEETRRLSELRQQTETLLEQQHKLQEAVRNLVEAGVLQGVSPAEEIKDLEQAIERLDAHLGQLAQAIASMGRREG